MKKLICLVLALLCVVSVAQAAPPDLSIYTYDQLIALQHFITHEIMNRPEWKEVTVPAGQWIVGVDIPEGEYSINPTGDGAYLRIKDERGSLVTSGGIRDKDDAIGKIYLKEGASVEIEDGSLVFAPAIVLGF